MREKRAGVSGHCGYMRRMWKSEVTAVQEASQCQEQFYSMVGDLSAWGCLEPEVRVSCEAVDSGLVVENLPWSSQRAIWSNEKLSEGSRWVEDGQGAGLASDVEQGWLGGRSVGCWVCFLQQREVFLSTKYET